MYWQELVWMSDFNISHPPYWPWSHAPLTCHRWRWGWSIFDCYRWSSRDGKLIGAEIHWWLNREQRDSSSDPWHTDKQASHMTDNILLPGENDLANLKHAVLFLWYPHTSCVFDGLSECFTGLNKASVKSWKTNKTWDFLSNFQWV